MRGVGIGIVVTAIIMGIALSGNKSMTDKEIIARAKELGMIEDTVLSDTVEEETDSEKVTTENTVPPKDQSKIDKILAEADSAGMDQDKSNVQGDGSGTDYDAADGIVAGDTEAENAVTDNNAADKTNTTNDSQGIDAESEAGEDSDGETPDKKNTAESNKDKADAVEADNKALVSSAVKTITVVSGDGSYSVAKKLENAGIISSASNYDAYLCEHGYDKKLQTGTFSIPSDASDEQIARIVTRTE